MKKLSLISLGILASLQVAHAQTISSKKWADLFSYNNVLAMKEDNGKIVAATENGIFIIPFQQEKLPNCLKQTVCMRLKFQLLITIHKQNRIGRLSKRFIGCYHSGWDYLCC
jgi:hypothetical protein